MAADGTLELCSGFGALISNSTLSLDKAIELDEQMVKLTVIYNLPSGANHEEFLRWRTTEHQKENMSIPGVIKSDFYVIKSSWQRKDAPYRYMTEAYFPDMETFEKSFFDPEYQARLAKSLELIADPLFLISEEVISQVAVA